MLLPAVGCASVEQADTVGVSGFLDDYSQLQPGEEGEALLRYRNPDADFDSYDKVRIEAIDVYASSDLDGSFRRNVRYLAGHLRDSLIAALREDYEIVDNTYMQSTILRTSASGEVVKVKAGEGVLVLRVAITEARDEGDVSRIVAVEEGGASRSDITTETLLFAGGASAELEILDGVTRERLFAAVDRQVRRRVRTRPMTSWDDVLQVYDEWAMKTRDRLRRERAASRW